MFGIAGGANFYNCYSVGIFSNLSNLSVGYIGGLVGSGDSRTTGGCINIENCFCIGNEFASMYVTNGNLPTDECVDEYFDFNCAGTNLQGYSERLGEKFLEDLNGLHKYNPILAWQKLI